MLDYQLFNQPGQHKKERGNLKLLLQETSKLQ